MTYLFNYDFLHFHYKKGKVNWIQKIDFFYFKILWYLQGKDRIINLTFKHFPKKIRGETVKKEKDYRISFFKPTTEFSRKNRNLVLILVSIWAVAIFGFQILLRVMQKPTPEKSLITFEEVWDNVEMGKASDGEKIKFANSVLSVLGKSILLSAPEKKEVLSNAFSWVVYDLVNDADKGMLQKEITMFEKKKKSILTLNDKEYIAAKDKIIGEIAPVLKLNKNSLKAKLIPLELRADLMKNFSKENKTKIKGIMSLYLTHNQSVLTDTIFLGFPFHYFYTAIFLLVLFVALCWVYCFIIDRMHSESGIKNS